MATEVVIKSTPFNSVESGGKYDRPVFAQDFADFFNVVAGHGIVASEGSFDSPEMKPIVGGDNRSISVATGYAVLGGRLAEIEQTTQIDAEIGGVKDRYDRLVLEMSDDLEDRNTKLKLLKGVEGAGKPPDIVQEKNFFQLSLCKWKQAAGSALITEFVDERKDRSVCGFFYPLSIVTEPMLNSYLLNPTKTIPEQADLNDYKDFGNWLCVSAAVAKTLKNCPITDGGFALRVMRGASNNYRVQEIISGKGHRIYRIYTGTSFDDWKSNLYTTDFNNNEGVTIKKLWENAAVVGNFPTQTISVNGLSGYKFIAVETSTVQDNTVALAIQTRRKIDIFRTDMEDRGSLAYSGFIYRSAEAARGSNAVRAITINDNNVIFGTGVKTLFNGSTMQDDTMCRPTRIYGFLHK